MRAVLSPVRLLTLSLGIAFIALVAAFASEAFLGLEPCPLCIMQRWAFVAVIVLSALGLIARKKPGALNIALGATGLAFIIDASIALYHSGIERKWWTSALEGCSVPAEFFSTTPSQQSILENIMSAPTGRCDEIPWADPLIGLSMANYNVLLGAGFAALCFAGLFLNARKTKA